MGAENTGRDVARQKATVPVLLATTLARRPTWSFSAEAVCIQRPPKLMRACHQWEPFLMGTTSSLPMLHRPEDSLELETNPSTGEKLLNPVYSRGAPRAEFPSNFAVLSLDSAGSFKSPTTTTGKSPRDSRVFSAFWMVC